MLAPIREFLDEGDRDVFRLLYDLTARYRVPSFTRFAQSSAHALQLRCGLTSIRIDGIDRR